MKKGSAIILSAALLLGMVSCGPAKFFKHGKLKHFSYFSYLYEDGLSLSCWYNLTMLEDGRVAYQASVNNENSGDSGAIDGYPIRAVVDGKVLEEVQNIIDEQNIYAWDGFGESFLLGFGRHSSPSEFYMVAEFENAEIRSGMDTKERPRGFDAASEVLVAYLNTVAKEINGSVIEVGDLEGQWVDRITYSIPFLNMEIPLLYGWRAIKRYDERQSILTRYGGKPFAWGLEEAEGIDIEQNVVEFYAQHVIQEQTSTVLVQYLTLSPNNLSSAGALNIIIRYLKNRAPEGGLDFSDLSDKSYKLSFAGYTYDTISIHSSSYYLMDLGLRKFGNIFALIYINGTAGYTDYQYSSNGKSIPAGYLAGGHSADEIRFSFQRSNIAFDYPRL